MAKEENKTVKMEDLLKAYSEVMSKGYKPDTIYISEEWYKRICEAAEAEEKTIKRGKFSLTLEFMEEMFELNHGEIQSVTYNPDSRTIEIYHTNQELGFDLPEGGVVPRSQLPQKTIDRLTGGVEKHNANLHNLRLPETEAKDPVITFHKAGIWLDKQEPVFDRQVDEDQGFEAVALRNGEQIGKIEALKYQAHRDMAPIYSLGSPNPKGFSKGKAFIAGSLIISEVNAAFAFTDKFDLEITSAGPDGCGDGVMIIKDVELLFKGYVPEEEDIEEAVFYQFTAGGIVPWTSVETPKEEEDTLVRPTTHSPRNGVGYERNEIRDNSNEQVKRHKSQGNSPYDWTTRCNATRYTRCPCKGHGQP